MDTTVKLNLLEQGTRYDHYMELRDAFATGVVILDNALKVERNTTAAENRAKLQTAVDLIELRVNYLSDYASQAVGNYSPLGKLIRSIPPNRPAQLPEVSESTRRECEAEMKKARETGYAEDGGQESNSSNQGTSSKKPE